MEGADNYDLHPVNGLVTQLNMNKIPYNIPSDTYDKVVVSHVLEHLETSPYDVLMELQRICKPGGQVFVELPIHGNLVSHMRFLHSRNYMNPVTKRKTQQNCNYIQNSFNELYFDKLQRCSLKKILWKIKTRFLTWVDSFLYDSYGWVLEVRK